MSQDQVFTIDADADVPGFTAAYLRVSGSECAFVEASTSHALPRLLDALARAGRKPEDVRYVVVTHAHLDHAGGAAQRRPGDAIEEPRAQRTVVEGVTNFPREIEALGQVVSERPVDGG